MAVETKYKKGDTIYWYCNTDDEVHHAEVQFVNYIPVGFPELIMRWKLFVVVKEGRSL